MTETVLILGASGRFGRAATDAFRHAGWTVRSFDRKTGDLMRDAAGADVIVNALNPLYPDWQRDVPVLTRRVIAAAQASGATVLIPGNVYVFGPGTPSPWSETSAHAATNPLGRIRVEMEEAYARSGVRTIVLRAGDFLDTEASGNWFDRIMAPKIDRGVFIYPGDAEAIHAWAFLPDMARAAVELARMRESLPAFADIPFPGYAVRGRDLHAAVERATERPIRMKRFSYLPLWLLAPVWPMARKLLEMRYLWTVPHRLDGSRFHSLLPDFRDTPFDAAVAAALPASVQRQVDPDETVAARG